MNARIVVFSFAAVIAAGALALTSWAGLALLGY